ncbi:polysaccharide deacetylase family protein [Sulfitobacter sp. S190]|uniref:polysaccharide deacetylase family protein n=1 Tax=Sulfitobacter sp. S190 TaxID=2867022 RepID=UPI0021A8CAE5|nr:polysaccharide deacetylase family protein [Sulfitobacter sp. S190]UWR21965.1 polysaccharide deacetylase family protein [Sulfitobacter sp. S190]
MTDWSPVSRELAALRADGVPLAIWWRDDDAVSATPALDRLDALSAQLDLPVHIAVIPAHADRTLVDRVGDGARLRPLVHGWAHENHAPEGAKKAEFGHPRHDAADDSRRALHRLSGLFGATLHRLFVPPWNRVTPTLFPDLATQGYLGISTFMPRETVFAAPGLQIINTHLDPIFWRGTRGLLPEDALVQTLAGLLADRRTGATDATEPFGLLTHHLVHDADIWRFTQTCLSHLLDGGATPADLSPFKDTPHEQT